MSFEEDEEVFDVEILNTDMPEDLKVFMEKWELSLQDELPLISPGFKKLGLKNISMKLSEIYLYLDQISSQADTANACHLGFAYGLLNNKEKIPKELKEYILIFKTIFVDKQGLKSFMCLDCAYGKKEWGFNFIAEGFITPPERARFLCCIE